jgi:hypothetical protein
MSAFNIDLSRAKIPTEDGEVNEYINLEAADASKFFSQSRKVIFINGMKNSGRVHAESALALSLVQMCPVIGLFNRSSGFLVDLWQCLMDKNRSQRQVYRYIANQGVESHSQTRRLLVKRSSYANVAITLRRDVRPDKQPRHLSAVT